MHGLLMQSVRAERLHEGKSSVRPFAQYMSASGYGKYIWTINTLDRELAAPIIEWLEKGPETLYLSHHESELLVVDIKRTTSMPYSELLQRAMEELPPKFSSFGMITPMAFKKAGQTSYWLWPEARLIAQSALSRWNTFGHGAKLDDDDILEDIAARVTPHSFQVRSNRVAMDGIAFPATLGSISFQTQNHTAVRQVFNLCGRYAEFCGLGVKTAMGLGAVTYQSGEIALQKHGESPVARTVE